MFVKRILVDMFWYQTLLNHQPPIPFLVRLSLIIVTEQDGGHEVRASGSGAPAKASDFQNIFSGGDSQS